MKKTIYLLIALFLTGTISLFAQEDIRKITLSGDVIPPSPNAASLGLYGAIPVSHYTGTPDISIPLYEIDLDGKTFPITLSYHASGIRVSQEASWVGLGWSLNAGGIITRQVQDGIDFGPRTSNDTRTGYYYAPRLPEYFTYEDDYSRVTNLGQFIDDIENTDTEPDLYTYNFGNHAGVMMTGHISAPGNTTHEAHAIIRQPKRYVDITYHLQDEQWVAYDGDGYAYYFGTPEKTRTYTHTYQSQSSVKEYEASRSLDRSFLKSETSMWPLEPVTTSWMLDSIVSPAKNKITFSYTFEQIETVITYAEKLNMHAGGWGVGVGSGYSPGVTQLYTYSIITQALLDKITFNGGEVRFTTSNRLDLRSTGHHRYPEHARKLDKMQVVTPSGNEVKAVQMDYTYHGSTESNYTCRLMLQSIRENNAPPHQFGYNMGELPPKHSLATDHWGYYNHSASVRTDEPLFYLNASPAIVTGSPQIYIPGRDKSVNTQYLFNGILTSVQYPTGGKTVFSYESHDYPNTGSVTNERPATLTVYTFFMDSEEDIEDPEPNPERDAAELYSYFTVTQPVKNCILDIQYSREYYLDTPLYEDVYIGFRIEKQNTDGVYEPIPFITSGIQTFLRFSLDRNLSYGSADYIINNPAQGNYRVVLIKNSTLNAYYLSFSIKGIVEVTTPGNNAPGGGVRITAITHNAEGKYETTRYEYAYGDGTSSGILMIEPMYHQFQFESEPGTGYLWLFATSESITPATYSAQGSPVGYSYVKEVKGSGSEHGYTTYEYLNAEDDVQYVTDRAVNRFPVYPSLTNGLMRKMSVYNSTSQVVQSTQYRYEKKSEDHVQGIKRYIVSFPGTGFSKESSSGHLKLYAQRSQTWKLAEVIETRYEPQGRIETVKTFGYDPTYFINNEVMQTTSTSDPIKYVYKYPFDYTDAMSSQMKARHLMEVPLEVLSVKNNEVVSGEKISYMNLSGKILPAKTFTLATGVNATMHNYTGYFNQENTFEAYTANGKLTAIRGRDGIPVVYIWSYGRQYPVAEIRKATVHQVQEAMQSAGLNLDQFEGEASPDVTQLNVLRQLLPDAFITTYTYKPLVGIHTATNPAGITTYYDYDSANRLKESYMMNDGKKEIIEAYEYNYANQ